MNKLILNGISYILGVTNKADDVCDNCALNNLPGGCCSPCEVFDHHMKETKGSCYFIEDVEETEKAKEIRNDKKSKIASELYDVLGPLESCFDECPLVGICDSENTICDKLKDIAKY